jgi:hypothetical protein
MIERRLAEVQGRWAAQTATGQATRCARCCRSCATSLRDAGADRGADGAVGAGRRHRADGRRRRRGRHRGRLRRADAGQGHRQRRVLPVRRRVPGRRVHPERQLQGHGGVVQPALGAAAPPPRPGLHRALRRTRRGAEHEPRLGHRQALHRHHLRQRPGEGAQADQEDRPGPGGRPGNGPQHPGAAEDAGRRAVRRLRDPDPHEDDDPPRRAVRRSGARPTRRSRPHSTPTASSSRSRRCRWPAADNAVVAAAQNMLDAGKAPA